MPMAAWFSSSYRFPRRWRWKKAPRSTLHEQMYERELVLRDITALGGKASAHQLKEAFPERYHEHRIHKLLKRLTPLDLEIASRGRVLGRHSVVYKLRERNEAR